MQHVGRPLVRMLGLAHDRVLLNVAKLLPQVMAVTVIEHRVDAIVTIQLLLDRHQL